MADMFDTLLEFDSVSARFLYVAGMLLSGTARLFRLFLKPSLYYADKRYTVQLFIQVKLKTSCRKCVMTQMLRTVFMFMFTPFIFL